VAGSEFFIHREAPEGRGAFFRSPFALHFIEQNSNRVAQFQGTFFFVILAILSESGRSQIPKFGYFGLLQPLRRPRLVD
jgi:hypothetical protein